MEDLLGIVMPHTTTSRTVVRTFRRHLDRVNAVAFSPDGKHIASASNDGTALLWDVTTGTVLHVLSNHKDAVRTVAFSLDGKLLALGSADNSITLWDTTRNEALYTLEGHTGWVNAVAFSPDGKRLASGSGDKRVRLWDTTTGATLESLDEHTDWVRAVVFSPDGKKLASASYDSSVKLWDAITAVLLRTLEGHKRLVSAVNFSPNGKVLASASGDWTLKLWSTDTGKVLQTIRGHKGWVSSVVFSPDGKQLASASGDKTVKLWDVATGDELQTLQSHEDCVSAVAFSPDGRQLASASYDRTLRLWDEVEAIQFVRTEDNTPSARDARASPGSDASSTEIEFFDGLRQVRIIQWDRVPSLTLINALKNRFEQMVGAPVDWWPFQQPKKACYRDYSRISWKRCGQQLSIDVPAEIAKAYQEKYMETGVNSTGFALQSIASGSTSGLHQPHNATWHNPTAPSPTELEESAGARNNATNSTSFFKEIFWCVDEPWTEPTRTLLCSIRNVHQIPDDDTLCKRLSQEYNRVRGGLRSLFSWKKCMDVKFVKFGRVFTGRDFVEEIERGLPKPDPAVWDFLLTGSERVHMEIAGKQVLMGMGHPGLSHGFSDTISMIPKKCNGPLGSKHGTCGWGMRAMQGYSLRKILCWLGFLTALGLTFVAIWLTLVSKNDLQNAFVVPAFLIAVLMAMLAIPQILGVA